MTKKYPEPYRREVEKVYYYFLAFKLHIGYSRLTCVAKVRYLCLNTIAESAGVLGV